jgi:hypothetical protein
VRFGRYILKDKAPVLCESVEEWVLFMQSEERRVAETMIENVWVSTVFMGYDLSHRFGQEPLFFETMVFMHEEGRLKPSHFEPVFRTSVWSDAEAAHRQMVARMQAKLEEAKKTAEGILYAAVTADHD